MFIFMVGQTDGRSVGETVGPTDGQTEGRADGESDGRWVGQWKTAASQSKKTPWEMVFKNWLWSIFQWFLDLSVFLQCEIMKLMWVSRTLFCIYRNKKQAFRVHQTHISVIKHVAAEAATAQAHGYANSTHLISHYTIISLFLSLAIYKKEKTHDICIYIYI